MKSTVFKDKSQELPSVRPVKPPGASAMVRPRLPMTRAMCALGTSTISCGVDDGRLHWLQKTDVYLPSGYVRHSY